MRFWRDRLFFFTAPQQAIFLWIALDWLSWNMQFSAGQEVRLKNYGTQSSFYRRSLSMRRIDISVSIQLHNPYKVEKLSIRRVQICNFSRIRRKTEEWEPSKGQKINILRQAYMVTVVWAARGIDILFRYSYSSCALLDSSRLGEQKYAISTR